MSTEIKQTSVLVSEKGGALDYVSPDGEVLISVAVPPGQHRAGPYLALCPLGAEMQVREGIVAVPPRSGLGIQPYGPGSHDVGANPDWKPLGNGDELQMQLRRQVALMAQNNKAMQARQRSLDGLIEQAQRVPQAPASAPVPAPAPEAGEAVVE